MLDPDKDSVSVPAKMIPSFRTSAAIERKVETNILIKTWGGLGDQICAEPTIRFALKTFKSCKISLASECPELFSHLNFHTVYDLREVTPIEKNFFVFNTILDTSNLVWEFMSHMIINCVDYPSLCAFRCQLPVRDKEVRLVPDETSLRIAKDTLGTVKGPHVAVHPGRHWQSKTFPKDWWDAVLAKLILKGVRPIIIGANTDDNRGTVDVDTAGCLDLRNDLTVMDSVALLQNVSALITNDSSPLHMAASGPAWIYFVATCKHPDYISHWRNGQWAWRMQNLGHGGIWDVLDYCPNKANKVEVENVGDDLLRSWLPDPDYVVMRVLGANP